MSPYLYSKTMKTCTEKSVPPSGWRRQGNGIRVSKLPETLYFLNKLEVHAVKFNMHGVQLVSACVCYSLLASVGKRVRFPLDHSSQPEPTSYSCPPVTARPSALTCRTHGHRLLGAAANPLPGVSLE